MNVPNLLSPDNASLEKYETSSTETLACDPEQMTITTVLEFQKGSNDCEKFDTKNGVIKVESQPAKEKDVEKDDRIVFSEPMKEKLYSVALQIFIPFMIAGIGTIGAGLILGSVEKQEVFKDVKALYILVPAIIGLKGNLDMCLASRMSTQANLGNMDKKSELVKMIIGNIALVQVQAIVASFIVSIFAISASAVINNDFEFNNALLLAAASTITATSSCFLLDFVLIAVISISRKLTLNPDNLATPMAASIGDVVSLMLLSSVASALYILHDTYYYTLFVILGVYLFIFLPMWIVVVRKNKYTRSILKDGWVPVISALFISGMGGLVLDTAVDDFAGFVVFQPIINGIGGNLVSIQSSRISTMLHQTSVPGIIPPHTKQWIAPWTAIFAKLYSSKTARLLILLSIPGQTVFVFVADAVYNGGVSTLTPAFVGTYLTAFLIQLIILLYVAHLLIHTMWRFKMDPDNSSIPYLTSLGDLLGTCLLFLGFMFLRAVDQEYTPIP